MSEPPPTTTAVTAGPRSVVVLNSGVLTFVALLILVEQALPNLKIDAIVSVGVLPSGVVFPNPLKFSTQQQGTPWDTLVLLALWAYCGARVLMGADQDEDHASPVAQQ